MRDLPSMAQACGLRVVEVQSHILADIGSATFFLGFIDNYGPFVSRFGLQPPETVEAWMTEQHQRMEDGRFFGSLNYHAYLLRP
jgi:hypothetical protein